MLKAIIWDYDGTLVDTRRKNLEITKAIMKEVTGNDLDSFSALQSLDQYQNANEDAENWRELYKNYFQLSDPQIEEAGAMWKEYQMKDDTEVSFFSGMANVITHLDTYQHGIVSQNARENILSFLSNINFKPSFPKLLDMKKSGTISKNRIQQDYWTVSNR